MEDFEMYTSKVYIQIDENNRVLRCEGGYTMANIKNIDEWIFIDEGDGDKYNLCQSHYFEGGLYTSSGVPIYKWNGLSVVKRDEDEIKEDENKTITPISENELMKAQINALSEENEFLSDCLIEMAQVVYA